MNENISKQVEAFERTIQWIDQSKVKAIERYNRIMKTYFDSSNVKNAIVAAGGNTVLNLSKAAAVHAGASSIPAATSTALATTSTSTALSPALTSGALGTTAAVGGGVSVASAALPISLAVIGGLALGKGIGDFICSIVDKNKGEAELKELQKDVLTLKGYCKSMNDQLSITLRYIKEAKEKVSAAKKQLKDQEYPKKDENMKRIKFREKELETIVMDINKLISAINNVYVNLSQLN